MEQPPSKRLKGNWNSDVPKKDIAKHDYAIQQLSEADPFDVETSVTNDIEEVGVIGSRCVE